MPQDEEPTAAPAPPPLRAVPYQQLREAQGKAKIPVARSKVASTRAFRRIRADRVLGVLGLAFVVFATWLVFNWPEPEPAKVPRYGVNWPEDSYTLYDEEVDILRDVDAGLLQVTRNIPDKNLTRVSVTISWMDDVGDEEVEWDILSINLTGPPSANLTLSARGLANDTERLTLNRTGAVNPLPDVREVVASTDAEALAAVGDRSMTNGTGDWLLEVHLDYVGDNFDSETTRALGECPEQASGTMCTRDRGQTVRILVEYRTYRVQVQPQ